MLNLDQFCSLTQTGYGRQCNCNLFQIVQVQSSDACQLPQNQCKAEAMFVHVSGSQPKRVAYVLASLMALKRDVNSSDGSVALLLSVQKIYKCSSFHFMLFYFLFFVFFVSSWPVTGSTDRKKRGKLCFFLSMYLISLTGNHNWFIFTNSVELLVCWQHCHISADDPSNRFYQVNHVYCINHLRMRKTYSPTLWTWACFCSVWNTLQCSSRIWIQVESSMCCCQVKLISACLCLQYSCSSMSGIPRKS